MHHDILSLKLKVLNHCKRDFVPLSVDLKKEMPYLKKIRDSFQNALKVAPISTQSISYEE